jgi:hypothetical protein
MTPGLVKLPRAGRPGFASLDAHRTAFWLASHPPPCLSASQGWPRHLACPCGHAEMRCRSPGGGQPVDGYPHAPHAILMHDVGNVRSDLIAVTLRKDCSWRNRRVSPSTAFRLILPVHMTNLEGALRGRLDSFAKPSVNGRYLRTR